MPFKMSFSKDEIKGIEPVPAGLYTVAFFKFSPKLSSKGDSVNLNGIGKIISHPEFANRQIWANLNTQIGSFIQDFSHSFGLPLDVDSSGNLEIPGTWNSGANFNPDNPETWVYEGPLIGQTAQWEVGIKDFNGPKQEIIRFVCKIPDCEQKYPETKHSKDMRKKA
jgi:hypothetical protein